MSDKDFNKREVFSKCFPTASLVICLYHTLRSFQTEIACEKMGVTSADGLRCHEIFSKSRMLEVYQYTFKLSHLKD